MGKIFSKDDPLDARMPIVNLVFEDGFMLILKGDFSEEKFWDDRILFLILLHFVLILFF